MTNSSSYVDIPVKNICNMENLNKVSRRGVDDSRISPELEEIWYRSRKEIPSHLMYRSGKMIGIGDTARD